MLQKKYVAIIKTDILCSVPFFLRKSCSLRENMAKYFRAGQATWKYGACPFHAGYLRLQIHTLRLCNTHCFSTATMVARKRLIFTFYAHCLSFLRMEVFQIICKLFSSLLHRAFRRITLIINQQMHYIKFHIKTLKIAPTCFDPKIILRELYCSLLKSF